MQRYSIEVTGPLSSECDYKEIKQSDGSLCFYSDVEVLVEQHKAEIAEKDKKIENLEAYLNKVLINNYPSVDLLKGLLDAVVMWKEASHD